MTSPFSPSILGGKRLGADGLYLRIKKPWKCRCALSDGGQGESHSWHKGQQDLFRPF